MIGFGGISNRPANKCPLLLTNSNFILLIDGSRLERGLAFPGCLGY
jgi:hypothetical protein